MHWLFFLKCVQMISGFSISTPSCSFAKSTACRMERKESRLQQLGPPISPMAARDRAVILWDRAKGSTLRGVEPEAIETNIPELIPAPQAPQKPQAPPGTFFPRFIISPKAFGRSRAPPAL